MTNKPMLSVERELIAGICDDFEAGRHFQACAGASKLRAILEDQHRPPPVRLYCNVSNVHITCNEDGSYTINPMPAAQHQGNPVAGHCTHPPGCNPVHLEMVTNLTNQRRRAKRAKE